LTDGAVLTDDMENRITQLLVPSPSPQKGVAFKLGNDNELKWEDGRGEGTEATGPRGL
jgi:hypothetical protein